MDIIEEIRLKICEMLMNFAWDFGMKKGIKFLKPDVIKQHTDQIIFELIKEKYIETFSCQTKSLNKIAELGELTELKRLSRNLQYSNHYRKKLAQEFENDFGIIPEKLQNIGENRSNGFKLHDYDLLQMDTMKSLEILKYITDKRIVSVKKISNKRLIDDFKQYRDYFSDLCDPYNRDFIIHNILLFDTEIKFSLESTYRLADRLSKYNNCKSKVQFSDDAINHMMFFNAKIHYNNGNYAFAKENSLVMIKMQYIDAVTPDNLYDKCREYYNNLQFSFLAKQFFLNKTNIKEAIKNLTWEDEFDFIFKYYNVGKILTKEATWESKKIKYMRDIYNKQIKTVESPKIK